MPSHSSLTSQTITPYKDRQCKLIGPTKRGRTATKAPIVRCEMHLHSENQLRLHFLFFFCACMHAQYYYCLVIKITA